MLDWAVVKLEKPTVGRTPAPLRRSGSISDGVSVNVIGHPLGLRMMYAPGANVQDNSNPAFFGANLDIYSGSGGMVVNAATHEVEGILVRGGPASVTTRDGCNVSLVCPHSGCRGEEATRISAVLEAIPASPAGR